ncbi:MAG: hypothetical protein HRT68_16230 [Flavobacteriaceae bacterium]|nr:hypothetical protein [Flavobacteriaceae bacterium]
MFWKKKIKDPQKGELTYLEKSVFEYLISQLPERQSLLVKEQLKYLTLIKRIEYKNDIVTEMYPEQYGIIPKEKLFGRTEEFRLAYVKYKIGGVKYTSEIHMAMGQVFDIKIRPKPDKKEIAAVEFLEAKIDSELDINTY